MPIRELGNFGMPADPPFSPVFCMPEAHSEIISHIFTQSGRDSGVFPRLNAREKSTVSFRCPFYLYFSSNLNFSPSAVTGVGQMLSA